MLSCKQKSIVNHLVVTLLDFLLSISMANTPYQSETIEQRIARRTKELDEDFAALERQARDAARLKYVEKSFSNARAGLDSHIASGVGTPNEIMDTTTVKGVGLRQADAAISSPMLDEGITDATEFEDGEVAPDTKTPLTAANGRASITSNETATSTLPSQIQDVNGPRPQDFVPPSVPSLKSNGTRSIYSERKFPQFCRPKIVPRSMRDLSANIVTSVSNGSIALANTTSSTSGGRSNSSGSSAPQSPGSVVASEVELPDWYKSLRVNKHNEPDRGLVINLQNLRSKIMKARNDPSTINLDILREELHTNEFRTINEAILKRSRILDIDVGLPVLFRGTRFPHDVQDDAHGLFNKWCSRDFDPDILRGIHTTKGAGGRSGTKFGDNIHRKNGNAPGPGDLVNGQWWPSQLCTMRDGAHGHSQAGIYGTQKDGALSIVVSSSEYEDKDEGNEIWYTGTKDKTMQGTTTEHTKFMLANVVSGKPIRVLRSGNAGVTLNNINPYRPKAGYRFDGMYKVVDSEVLNETAAHYRFHLVRCAGQNPIRHAGSTARPTNQELAEYEKVRKAGRMSGLD